VPAAGGNLKFGVQKWIEERLEELAEIPAATVGCFSVIDGLGRLDQSPLSPGTGVDLGGIGRDLRTVEF
jgi:hypothetical protein